MSWIPVYCYLPLQACKVLALPAYDMEMQEESSQRDWSSLIASDIQVGVIRIGLALWHDFSSPTLVLSMFSRFVEAVQISYATERVFNIFVLDCCYTTENLWALSKMKSYEASGALHLFVLRLLKQQKGRSCETYHVLLLYVSCTVTLLTPQPAWVLCARRMCR